jgi:hypothetical protein
MPLLFQSLQHQQKTKATVQKKGIMIDTNKLMAQIQTAGYQTNDLQYPIKRGREK